MANRLKVFRNGLAKLVAGIVLAASLYGKALANDYYVSPEGDDSRTEQEAQNLSMPWKTVQYAIDSIEGTAENPHTIHVAPGTYFKNIVMNEYESLKGKDRETTILDGNQNGSVITGASNTTIEGFTIRNGKSDYGGGIDCKDSRVNVINNRICNNQGKYFGGGITFYGESILGGEALLGLIKDNVICDNVALRRGSGGGIYSNNSSLVIDNNILYNNMGTSEGDYWPHGYQIRCDSDYIPSNTIITNNIVRDSKGSGIGIFYINTSAKVENNLIINNEEGGLGCSSGVDSGSACRGPKVSISNNIIANNEFGIGIGDAVVSAYNNTIVDNKSVGVSLVWLGQLSLKNNIIFNNTDDLYVRLDGCDDWDCDCFLNVNYCNIGDGDYQGLDGNISADPLFVNPGNYDYHLRPDSPCLAPNCAPNYDQMGAYARYIGIENLRVIDEDGIQIIISGVPGSRVRLYANQTPHNITSSGKLIRDTLIGIDGKLTILDDGSAMPPNPLEVEVGQRFYQAVITVSPNES